MALATVLLASPARSPAITVYDPANHTQNILQAVRALEQVRRLVDQLETMQRNLERISDPSWRDLRAYMAYLNDLAAQGDALAYSFEGLFDRYRGLFVGAVPTAEPAYVEVFDAWSRTVLDTLAATLDSVGAQSRNYVSTQEQLAELRTLADGSRGNLQALNVSNMLASHLGQEVAKLNQLLAAQINAQNVYWGYELTLDANREATERWVLDNGEQPFPTYSGESGSTGVPSGWPYPCGGCSN